jgi:hypothetical protein
MELSWCRDAAPRPVGVHASRRRALWPLTPTSPSRCRKWRRVQQRRNATPRAPFIAYRASEQAMPRDDPKLPSDDAQDLTLSTRANFDIRDLGAMREDEADAEWLRQPEAWHMH